MVLDDVVEVEVSATGKREVSKSYIQSCLILK